jgi:hypothetical protein
MIWLALDRDSGKWFVLKKLEKEIAHAWIKELKGPFTTIYYARTRCACLNTRVERGGKGISA